jgi:cation transport ATPase
VDQRGGGRVHHGPRGADRGAHQRAGEASPRGPDRRHPEARAGPVPGWSHPRGCHRRSRGGATGNEEIAFDGVPADQLLAQAARLEAGSEHPAARAIVAEAKRRGTAPITGLPFLLRLGRATARTINVNLLAFGLVFNATMLVLSAVGVITPILGAIGHNLGSVAVVLNSARLPRFR